LPPASLLPCCGHVFHSFFIGIFDNIGLWLGNFILAKLGKQISPSLLSTAVFASLLAFVWGVAFAVINKERYCAR
jgi:uncharacterized membrane protein YjjB (DUF3815 family)